MKYLFNGLTGTRKHTNPLNKYLSDTWHQLTNSLVVPVYDLYLSLKGFVFNSNISSLILTEHCTYKLL